MKIKELVFLNVFTKDRPVITNKEALKGVIPVKWSKEVKDDKEETIIQANKQSK